MELPWATTVWSSNVLKGDGAGKDAILKQLLTFYG